jgi:hypothetical protein
MIFHRFGLMVEALQRCLSSQVGRISFASPFFFAVSKILVRDLCAPSTAQRNERAILCNPLVGAVAACDGRLEQPRTAASFRPGMARGVNES